SDMDTEVLGLPLFCGQCNYAATAALLKQIFFYSIARLALTLQNQNPPSILAGVSWSELE
ncbi:MAG: hypothetical protein ABIJ42_05885, partial [Acidobacteriota bacterium]